MQMERAYNLVWQMGEVEDHTIRYGKGGRQKTIQFGVAKEGGRRPYNLVWQRGKVEDHTIWYGKGGRQKTIHLGMAKGEVEDHTLRYGKGNSLDDHTQSMAKGQLRRPYIEYGKGYLGCRGVDEIWAQYYIYSSNGILVLTGRSKEQNLRWKVTKFTM